MVYCGGVSPVTRGAVRVMKRSMESTDPASSWMSSPSSTVASRKTPPESTCSATPFSATTLKVGVVTLERPSPLVPLSLSVSSVKGLMAGATVSTPKVISVFGKPVLPAASVSVTATDLSPP